MSTSKEGPRWLPLESSPEGYTRWSASLGLDTTKWSYQEVFGLDLELLAWVRQPVKAVVLLFPITEDYEKYRKQQDEEIAENGVQGVADVIYFKQTIANACGTFALLHALANSGVELADGPLKTLFERAKPLDPYERAGLLVQSEELTRVHDETAHTGQTATPALEDDTTFHFVTFVDVDGNLVELDGRRESPVNHGPIDTEPGQSGLLHGAVKVIQRIIEMSGGSVEFNVTALVPADADE